MKRIMNIQPSLMVSFALTILPFLGLIAIYWVSSEARLAENAFDKLLPSFEQIGASIKRLALEPNARTGEVLLWADTLASLQRLFLGISISAILGLIIGVLSGLLPVVRSSVSPLVTAISLVPPMAILPILFIVFGLDELSKIMLIIIGTAPIIARDIEAKTREIPQEIFIKAQTLGANTWQILIRVALPLILPRLIAAVRLSLGPAWLFLIAAEAIASQEGLGYRIFLVRRYLAMDVILPYVLWITCLAYLTDHLLKGLSQWLFPWFHSEEKKS